MTTVIVSKDYIQDLENRIKSLENMVSDLLTERENKTDAIFKKLVKSAKFKKYTKETIALYKKDPSQFVDLYESFQRQKLQ